MGSIVTGLYFERVEGRELFCTRVFVVTREGRVLTNRVSCKTICAIRAQATDLNRKPTIWRSNKEEESDGTFVHFVDTKALHVARHTVIICTMFGSGL